jgi:hypothetical protein
MECKFKENDIIFKIDKNGDIWFCQVLGIDKKCGTFEYTVQLNNGFWKVYKEKEIEDCIHCPPCISLYENKLKELWRNNG